MAAVSAEISDTQGAVSGDPDVPEAGQLVRVRRQQWVVSDDDLGDELTVVWEVEPGREIVPATQLPQVTETNWDDPQTLGAFLDAIRWGTAASADAKTSKPRSEAASPSRSTSSNQSPARSRCRASICSSPTTWAWARHRL